MGESPILLAIEKIMQLFDFQDDICLYKVEDNGQNYSDRKTLCVLDEFGCSFLELVSSNDTIDKLPPILYLSFETDSAMDILFKRLTEVSPERFRYLCIPFNVVTFVNEVNHLLEERSRLYDNPFKKLLGLKQKLPATCETKPDQFFSDLSEAASVGGRKDNSRLKLFHDVRSETGKLVKFISCECCLEYIYASLKKRELKNKKILWIENKPDDLRREIEFLKDYFSYEFDIKEKSKDIKQCFESLKAKDFKHSNYDLVLVDIFLGEDEELIGKDFLRVLSQNYPHIPAFVLSASEDLELISTTVKEGADFYILKKYARSIPYYLRRFYEAIGEIALLIKDENLRKNLVGNIRTWQFNKESLWFGDKCYHMINHGYIHAANDWRLLNQLFPYACKVMSPPPTDEDIYCLSMATWLHDIGHAGNELYGEPHSVRDNHSVISGEFIVKHPEHYGILGYDKTNPSPYRDHSFSFDNKLTVLQSIKWKIVRGSCSLLEKIALMCIYHSSKFPIDEDDVYRIKAKRQEKELSSEWANDKEPIHLASIAALANDNVILKLTSILRIIDSLDHSQNRVGDERFRSIKMETNRRDVGHQFLKLYKEVNLLAEKASSENKSLKEKYLDEFINLNFPRFNGHTERLGYNNLITLGGVKCKRAKSIGRTIGSSKRKRYDL